MSAFDLKDWPYGNYLNLCLCGCGDYFQGPKRANLSWSCLTEEQRASMLEQMRGPYQ